MRRGLPGLGLVLLLSGCSSAEPRQVDIIQGLAKTLLGIHPTTSCAYFVPEQQGDVLCGGQLSQLQHYGPGFEGSVVTRRGRNLGWGWRWSKEVVVPVHYAGRRGQGDLDVKLRRVGKTWRIALIAPPGVLR